ncbi:hypothetical protein L3V86_01015 [Thiotrichales bacterium 19S11-10]|nr:hypothetical protein [Thiotrichales bacterium 19S11-10]
MKRITFSILQCLLFYFMAIGSSYALQKNNEHKYNQADMISAILDRLSFLNNNLDLIRQAIGKPKIKKPAYHVRNAHLNEVYFQTQILSQKANLLAYNVTGIYIHQPNNLDIDITLDDIMTNIENSNNRIGLVKENLSISNIQNNQAFKKGNLDDIFNMLIVSNVKLDNISYQKTSPVDVFKQIKMSIEYIDDVLSFYNLSTKIKQPQKQVNKRPIDVFYLLIKCLNDIQNLAKKLNIKTLSVETNIAKTNTHITPNDVLSIAKIILAEVKYLDSQLISNPLNRHILLQNIKYKTPSNVYYEAEVLSSKIKLLDLALVKIKLHND